LSQLFYRVSTADNIHYAVSCDLKSSCSYAVDETKIPSGKKTVIFENCHQGDPKYLKAWKSVLKGVGIVAWEGTTTANEAIEFNNSGKPDNNGKHLMDYCKELVDSKTPNYDHASAGHEDRKSIGSEGVGRD